MSERDVTPPKLPFNLRPPTIILILVVIAVVAVAASSFFVVDQTEQSVVLRLGRYHRTVEPGLQWKLPLGIEQNYNVQTRVVQTMSFGFRTEQAGVNTVFSDVDYPEESIMLTGDLNIIDVEWIIQYRITDPRAWLFNVENREKTIRDISQSVMNLLVGDRAILDVLGDERTNIEFLGRERMNEIFDTYNLGINVTEVRLQNIVPPVGRVQDAFEDVNRAVQDMNRLINEGRQQYNADIPRARGEAQRVVEEARGYSAERVNNARGDVARFNSVLTEYARDPDTTRRRLYVEMIEDVFAPELARAGAEGEDSEAEMPEERSELIDRNLDNFLPLLNLQGGSAGTTTGGGTGGGTGGQP